MPTLRVYMFVYLFPPEFTGASRQAINLAKKLRNKGVHVTFITATQSTTCKHASTYADFPVIRIQKSWGQRGNVSIICYWIKLLYILLRNYKKYDLIHVIGIFTHHNILAVWGRILGKKQL